MTSSVFLAWLPADAHMWREVVAADDLPDRDRRRLVEQLRSYEEDAVNRALPPGVRWDAHHGRVYGPKGTVLPHLKTLLDNVRDHVIATYRRNLNLPEETP